jgi:hypothetical protein
MPGLGGIRQLNAAHVIAEKTKTSRQGRPFCMTEETIGERCDVASMFAATKQESVSYVTMVLA